MFTRTGITELAIRWLMLAFAVWFAAPVVDGIYLDGWSSTLLVAGVLGLLNMSLKPVLLLLSLPVTLITFGLFVIVISAILLLLTNWLANNLFDVSLSVDGLWAAPRRRPDQHREHRPGLVRPTAADRPQPHRRWVLTFWSPLPR